MVFSPVNFGDVMGGELSCEYALQTAMKKVGVGLWGV
jgi:hypothetical protein